MSAPHFDIVTVGGGLAGSAFAKVMAERGAKVLVLEQESRFRDRVRGELLAPWGVAEAKELGLLKGFSSAGACEAPLLDIGTGPRDLVATSAQKLPCLCYSHPRAQEVLIDAAQSAGAEVRRGVAVQKIESGTVPFAECQSSSGAFERITARLVVAADGRNSAARKWVGFKSRRDEHPFLFAGVLLGGVSGRQDLISMVYNPDLGISAFAVPQDDGRFRAYLAYHTSKAYRLQGNEKLPMFIAESAKVAPVFAELFAGAKACGPLASFDSSESWVEGPYREGVALIGDAAAVSDPAYGQGMSLALRDVRVLRDQLSSDSDWDRAARRYAQQHDNYFANCHTVTGWLRHLFQEQTPAAALQRQKAMPLIAQDSLRVPDHLISGPEMPMDETVKLRFFGEC